MEHRWKTDREEPTSGLAIFMRIFQEFQSSLRDSL